MIAGCGFHRDDWVSTPGFGRQSTRLYYLLGNHNVRMAFSEGTMNIPPRAYPQTPTTSVKNLFIEAVHYLALKGTHRGGNKSIFVPQTRLWYPDA